MSLLFIWRFSHGAKRVLDVHVQDVVTACLLRVKKWCDERGEAGCTASIFIEPRQEE